jgi:hypothetical protein
MQVCPGREGESHPEAWRWKERGKEWKQMWGQRRRRRRRRRRQFWEPSSYAGGEGPRGWRRQEKR